MRHSVYYTTFDTNTIELVLYRGILYYIQYTTVYYSVYYSTCTTVYYTTVTDVL